VAEAPGGWSVKDLVWRHDPRGCARTKRSPLWGMVYVYGLDRSNDVYVRCKVSALDGVETYLFLQGGQTSKGTKHFETTGKGKGSPTRRADHLIAALYLAKNLKGGPRTRLTAADGAITQVMRPADRREHHVRFVLMQIMMSCSQAFATSAYVRSFLAGFGINYAPPALGPVTLNLSELASFISSMLVDLFTSAANDYMGVPWAHFCIDMWTVPGSRASYGALILRFTDLETLDIKKKSLDVWACPGKHNHKAIVKWQQEVLGRVGIAEGDIASTTNDSGSNVRNAEAVLMLCGIPVRLMRWTWRFGRLWERRASLPTCGRFVLPPAGRPRDATSRPAPILQPGSC